MTCPTPGTWRTGRKVFRTVYADDRLIGVMDRPEDAALCAAAPELLEALKSMLSGDHTPDKCPVCEAARAVVALVQSE